MSGFFEELQRRKVYRVAAAYGCISGLGVAELESATGDFNAVNRLSIALILAWAYDVTPQCIRTTPAPATPRRHRRRNLIMLIAIGVIISVQLHIHPNFIAGPLHCFLKYGGDAELLRDCL
jgi:hypothetical protein